MTFQVPGLIHNRLAAADYSAKRYYAMALSSSDVVTLATVAGQRIDGVLQNEPESGEQADIMLEGITKAKLSGTVAIGDRLMTAADGTLLKATGGAYVVGRAMASGVTGDIAPVHLKGEGVIPVTYLTFPVVLANLADGDIVTTFTPGFAGTIEDFDFTVTSAVTTASKASTLNLEIGTTNVTGGALALTSANCTPLGAVVAASAITAANTFLATSTISIEAASTTTFIEGEGVLTIKVALG